MQPSDNCVLLCAAMRAVAVIGDICSAATVAAAGVAGDKQVPLVSPASSSPQLSGMPFFARTVPSDRYVGRCSRGQGRGWVRGRA
jgi:ABC-type branched-subunit amino acid transport system substrate-binding protein